MSTSSTSQDFRAMYAKRNQKEFNQWFKDPPSEFECTPTDDLHRWVVKVSGAPDTLYANETFQLQIDLTHNYPIEAPQVRFLPPPPLHPHVYSNGHICLDILHYGWTPALGVRTICYSILSMLSSATVKERPFDNDEYVRKCENGGPPRPL